MAVAEGLLVWVDCEMTGLDLGTDELIEIAVIVTDFELNPIDQGMSVVIKPSEKAINGMNDFVRQMHKKSALLEDLPAGHSLEAAKNLVIEYLEQHLPGDLVAPLAGNSVGTDRTFLMKYIPEIDNYLHYRTIDVSTIKELAKHWFPRAYFASPNKDGNHRALGDIRDSILELQYYRAAVFVDDSSLSTTQLRETAADVTTKFVANLV